MFTAQILNHQFRGRDWNQDDKPPGFPHDWRVSGRRELSVLKLTKSYFCCRLVAKLCPTLCNPMDYIAHQVLLSMGFSRQEHWSGLPFPSPGDLPNPGIEPASPILSGRFFTAELPGKSKVLSTALWTDRSLTEDSNDLDTWLNWSKILFHLYQFSEQVCL